MWGVRGRALPHPRLPALWAGCRGPLPTGCRCGGLRAWGPVTNPTARALAGWLCALWGRHEGARGGASCLDVGRLGSGALPSPTARPLGGLPGPTTHWLWVRGGAGVGTRHQPHSARSFELALRAVGAARGRPGGGRLLPGCGASGVGRSPTPDCPPSGRAAGAHYPLAVGAGGVRVWGPLTSPTARALASWLCALWGRHEGARGGRLLPGCGASGVGRSPNLDCPPSGRAAGAHYPLAVGAGGCGCGEPSPTPQRALLRAGFARCGGGTRAPRGGRSLPGCGASRVGRSPTPDCPPSGRAAGAHYPLAVGAVGCGRGEPSQTQQRALLRAGFARCGGGMRVPGGAPLAWVWGLRGRALSHPRLPALWAGCRSPLPTGCGCGGVRAWGPVTNPTARALPSWLCALWGRHEGARGEAPLAWMWGVRGRVLPHPRLPALWAGCRGPLPTGCRCGGLRAWGPVTNPTARALAGWLCALWGRHEGARGGASCLDVGRLGSGALPSPTARPLGGLPGPTTHWLWVRGGAGVGTRHQPHSARSFELALRAVGAARGRPGGGRLLPGCGASGVGRSPTPDCPPSGRAAGAHYPLAVGVGGVRVWGPLTSPTARALASWLCALWGRHEGARGGRLLPGCGASGVGRSPNLDCPPSGRAAGAHYPLAVGAGGCGCGEPSPTPQRALLRAGFARCWGGTRAPGGGRSLPGCGASRVGRSPTPDCPPSGRAAGAHYPLAVGAGECGRGEPSQTQQRALLRAGFARCGGGMRVPGGAPLAWVWGLRGRALSHPRLPALWAGCRSPLPTGCGCGGVRAWGPVTNPTARALLSWLCALWGRHEGARGEAPPAWMWGVRGRALPHPRLPALWAGCRGPLPTGCGCGGVRAWGPVTNPTAGALASWLCALWWRHEGARGGASCLGVGRLGSGALPAPTARPLAGLPGPTTHWLWVRGGAGVGTRHQPESARSCQLALRAVGAA